MCKRRQSKIRYLNHDFLSRTLITLNWKLLNVFKNEEGELIFLYLVLHLVCMMVLLDFLENN